MVQVFKQKYQPEAERKAIHEVDRLVKERATTQQKKDELRQL